MRSSTGGDGLNGDVVSWTQWRGALGISAGYRVAELFVSVGYWSEQVR